MECRTVSAGNDNSISWDKNGIPIPMEEKRYDIRVIDTENEYISELFIESSEESDFTSYGCKATNEIGSDYTVIKIEEKSKFRTESDII